VKHGSRNTSTIADIDHRLTSRHVLIMGSDELDPASPDLTFFGLLQGDGQNWTLASLGRGFRPIAGLPTIWN
jgi:hypothetical protein